MALAIAETFKGLAHVGIPFEGDAMVFWRQSQEVSATYGRRQS